MNFNHGFFQAAYRLAAIPLCILLLTAFPATAFSQSNSEQAQTPASVFSGIKEQFVKDIKVARDVVTQEGKDISRRTEAESEEFQDTTTGMKDGVVLGPPGQVLSDP
jgi:hypothetical protein